MLPTWTQGLDPALFDGSFFAPATNRMLDPRQESGTRRVYRLAGVVLDSVTTSQVADSPVIEGSFSLQVADNDKVYSLIETIPSGAARYSFGATMAFGSGGIGVEFYGAGSVLLGRSTAAGSATTSPAGLSLSQPVPSGAVNAAFYETASGGPATFDRLIVTTTQEPVDFFDGDSGGSNWSGQRFWSQSVRLGQSSELPIMARTGPPIWSSDSTLGTSAVSLSL